MTEQLINSPDDAATKVLVALQSLGIEHEVMDCDPKLADTAVFCEHYNIPPEVSANVIIAAGKSDPRQYAACVLLATTRLDPWKESLKLPGVASVSCWSRTGECFREPAALADPPQRKEQPPKSPSFSRVVLGGKGSGNGCHVS